MADCCTRQNPGNCSSETAPQTHRGCVSRCLDFGPSQSQPVMHGGMHQPHTTDWTPPGPSWCCHQYSILQLQHPAQPLRTTTHQTDPAEETEPTESYSAGPQNRSQSSGQHRPQWMMLGTVRTTCLGSKSRLPRSTGYRSQNGATGPLSWTTAICRLHQVYAADKALKFHVTHQKYASKVQNDDQPTTG